VGHYELPRRLDGPREQRDGRADLRLDLAERASGAPRADGQVIPVTDEIKAHALRDAGKPVDVAIVEIGGTVGDIESLPFLEAIRQLRLELSSVNTLFIHVTLVPHLGAARRSRQSRRSIR
jgi:CTP synthase